MDDGASVLIARAGQLPWWRRSARKADAAQLQAQDLLRALERRAQRMTGGSRAHSDDLAQATLDRLNARYGLTFWSWEEEKRLAYAYQTLHRLFLDECKRKRAALTPTGELFATDELPDPEQSFLQRQLSLSVEACLSQLSGEARDFLLKSFQLDSASDAQRELGFPKGSAANACHTRRRLMDRIKECLLSRGV